MKRSYVTLARALAYMDIDEMAPRGHVSFFEIVKALVERYGFQKFPSNVEDFDRSKGVEFSAGTAKGTPIQRLAIFDTLMFLETRSNTTDAQEILLEMLHWAADKFGLTFDPGMIAHWGFISSVIFKGDSRLLDVHPALAKISNRVSALLSNSWDESVEYKPIRLSMGHDPDNRKYPIAPFTIERKGQTRFTANKFYSEAPLPTDLHWQILEEFEKEVLNGSNVETYGGGKAER